MYIVILIKDAVLLFQFQYDLMKTEAHWENSEP